RTVNGARNPRPSPRRTVQIPTPSTRYRGGRDVVPGEARCGPETRSSYSPSRLPALPLREQLLDRLAVVGDVVRPADRVADLRRERVDPQALVPGGAEVGDG